MKHVWQEDAVGESTIEPKAKVADKNKQTPSCRAVPTIQDQKVLVGCVQGMPEDGYFRFQPNGIAQMGGSHAWQMVSSQK